MKATIKLVNVYDTILEETTKEIMVEAEGKKYLGGLLDNESYWISEEIKETLHSEEVNGTIEEVIDAIINVKNANGIKVYESTKRTLAWWGYLNGLFEEYNRYR